MKIGNSILAAVLLLLPTPSAHALDPSQPMKSYIQARFTTEDNGLPDNIVAEILQSRDGFLWIRTGPRQLGRFDGQRFTNLEDIEANSLTMTLGPNGDLWVGTPDGLLQIPAASNQTGSPLPVRHPLKLNVEFICLRFSRSGILWAGTTGGLYQFHHGNFSPVIPDVRIDRIEESSNGNLWLTTSQGFMEWDGSRVIPHPELATELGLRGEDIFHVLQDRRGITWICTRIGVARQVAGVTQRLQLWGSKNDGAFRVYEDPQGNVWIAGEKGLFRATAAGLELAVASIKPRYMYSDRDGNLWVGTNGEGLYRFTDRLVQMFTTADGLPGNLPMTVFTTYDGALWTGFNCGGLSRFDGYKFRIYNEKDGLVNSCVFALAEDSNHDLWIGTWGGGVFRFHNDSFAQYSKAQGLASDVVLGIVGARDGSVWLATSKYVSRLRDGQVRNYTHADGLSSARILGIHEDRSGRIWVGTDSGIDYLEGDRFLKVSSIPKDAARPIGEDRAGVMYVTLFHHGIYRVDHGQASQVLEGLTATTMIDTAQGDKWLNGPNLLRLPSGGFPKQRERDEPLDFARLGQGEGLISTEGSMGSPSLALTRDGKMWIATVQGLALVDLAHLPWVDEKPVIYVQGVTVGRNEQPPGQELVLPPGIHHVELRFDAIEITSPEKIHLQYRLDGVDSEWLDVDPPGHATYTNIPKGTHAFHVRACNRDGIWDRVGMVYIITQQPYFYETTWFRLAMIATGLLLLAGLYRLRLRQATARLKVRFDERLDERTRIARELHDTLLQTVQGSKFIADHALEKSNDSVPLAVRQSLERLSKWLGQATQEGRAALNSLRTSTTETNDLAAALRRVTEECVIDSSIAFRFSVIGSPRDTHPIPGEEIYRIGYEAIRNACEHSSASELEVALIYAQDLTLRVSDNGSGIEEAVLTKGKEGHFGLQGMRERAQRIGSKLTLVGSPDSGTQMILVIPGNVIFRKPSITRFSRIKTLFGVDGSSDPQ